MSIRWEADVVEIEDDSRQPLADPLTERELKVLRHIADGLSNREIAQELFLSLNTVKWYNQQIYRKLGVGSRTQAVAIVREHGLLDTDGPHDAPVSTVFQPVHNLPVQLSSFVGREQEIAEVKNLLHDTHLLTLTGPGGTGKTRLATEAAAELTKADTFANGIFFVDLAAISEPDQVGRAIAESLGMVISTGQHVSEKLAVYLRNRKVLLLLDNFEHLLQAALLVVDILSVATDVKIMVTSREALNIYGEQEYPVPPLGLPDLDDPDALFALADHESVALFIRRAQAVKPDFRLTDENASAVAELCVRLDGLPLAIELAAAQVKLFSPRALLANLGSRVTARTEGPLGLSERQRTLRGTIDWSYDLLDDAEKALFARMSVFQGGRTIETVEVVCCHGLPIDVVEGLESLLNKNLLRHEDGPEGEPRFTMLETIHDYGRERLQESGEAEAIYRQHAEYFTAMAELAEPHTRGGRHQMRWLRRLETDHENLRTMYRWCRKGGDIELGLRLVGALGYFWFRQGHYAEGEKWTAWALEASIDAPPAMRAALFDAAGIVAHFSHERDRGKRMHREALSLYQSLGKKREMGWVLIYLGAQSFGNPDEYEEAMAHAEEGLSALRSVDDKAGVAQALHVLGELARLHGDYRHATQVFEEGLSLARELGDILRQAFILDSLGYIALYNNEPETAAALNHESLNLVLEVGYKPHIPACLAGFAAVYTASGHLRRAARLVGAADALFDAHGFGPRPSDKPDVERTWATVRTQLGEVTFNALWMEGQAMSLEEAIAYAQEGPASDE